MVIKNISKVSALTVALSSCLLPSMSYADQASAYSDIVIITPTSYPIKVQAKPVLPLAAPAPAPLNGSKSAQTAIKDSPPASIVKAESLVGHAVTPIATRPSPSVGTELPAPAQAKPQEPAGAVALPGEATQAPPAALPVQVPASSAVTRTIAAVPVKPALPTWIVTTKDQTFRQVLTTWSDKANWTFNPSEHWAVDVDIPVNGSAMFRGDYISAVQALVGSTELGDTPLQPCFYANNVLRVIYYNESCDKMSAR